MSRLQVNLLGVSMKNPVIAASGTFGFGEEYRAFFDPGLLGGISSKGLTLHGSKGNGGVRVWETPAGMLNSIGLENPGVAHFIERELPLMRRIPSALLCNMGGHSLEDYEQGAAMLDKADIDILELNISCPNVKAGGMAFGMEPATAADVVRRVRALCHHPLLVKLSPNAPDLIAVARAVEEAGADGLSLTNTFLGMAIDVDRRRAVFDNVYAGLSGPAILPLALRMVHQVCKAVTIPVVGLGGIATWRDALCFLMAGATAVQMGTAGFADPLAMPRAIEGLEKYCEEQGLQNILEIRGIV